MGKHYGKEILAEVMRLKEKGWTHREIGIKYNLSKGQIKDLVERDNRKKRNKLLGIEISPQKQSRTLTKHQTLELENKRLKTENDLLRSFLQAAGRK